MAEILSKNIVHKSDGDISILLIDHDTTSTASLTSMLEQFSYKVTTVNGTSNIVSVIEKRKDIGLIIANIEMPHIDSDFFCTYLHSKDIPLILIIPKIKTKKASESLTKIASFFLKKPVSEKDIQNLWQHVLPKKSRELEKINTVENQEKIMDETNKEVEAFRETINSQRPTHASLLGRRPFIESFTTSETSQKRRSMANREWETMLECPIVIENKKEERQKVGSYLGRRHSLWTVDRHMKFLSAISILGENYSRPKSILMIMNDPDLTHRQISSHLQKYKAQVERINNIVPRNVWRSTDKTFEYPSNYEYPFVASNLANILISVNEGRNTEGLNFYLGGKLELSNHPFLDNILNESSMEMECVSSMTSNNSPYIISPTNDVNYTGLVSSGLTSNNLPDLPALPSSFVASNTDAFQMGYIPQPNPNPFQAPSSILETNRNHPTSILNGYVPQADLSHMRKSYNDLPNYTMNRFETNTNQMGGVSSGGSYVPSSNMISSMVQEGFPQTSRNHMGQASSRESYILPRDRVFYETNSTRRSLVSFETSYRIRSETNMTLLETNINQMCWGSSQERYVQPENIVSSETNTTQVDLVPAQTTHARVDSMVPPQTNMEEFHYDVPIEDLISFDTSVNEMGMHSLLGNYDSSERNIILSTNNLSHGSASNTLMEPTSHMHLGSTSQPIEGIDGVDNVGDMEWIDNMLNEDA